MDEYLAYEGISTENRARVEASEQKMLKRADLVIVVSKKLFQSKGSFNKHTYLVPNGVDYASYDRALHSNDPVPADIAQLPKPIIGYSGLISARLDLDLIQDLANTYPDRSFVLMGSVDSRWCEDDMQKLMLMSNVHFLGMKKIDMVPLYVASFDVCIVPYKISKETENLSALKLYDFMAAGKPIVTTNFPAVKEFKDVVYVADSKENFIHCVDKAFQENDDSLSLKRKQMASQNTWDHRVMQLSQVIKGYLRD